MGAKVRKVTNLELQERMISLVRAFGLHRPEETPCGELVAVAEAHALLELTRVEPLLQKDLAQKLRLEKSTVSRLVKVLEKRGWVGRKKSLHDGRAMELRLTEAGKKATARLAEARRAKFTRILEAIPEEELAPVIRALSVLEEAMNESG